MSLPGQGPVSPKWTRSGSTTKIPRFVGKSPSPLHQTNPYQNLGFSFMATGASFPSMGNHSFGSLEASGGDSIPQDVLEHYELQNRLSDFQYKNITLIEDNQKLQKQLESSEEVVADLKEELESMQKKIWNLQALHDRCRDPKSEIDELTTEILNKEVVIKTQQTKIKDLNKQIMVSSDDYDELKFKYEKTQELYYDMKAQFDSTQTVLQECQEKIADIESSETTELNRSNVQRLEELESKNEELQNQIQKLKKEKDDLVCQNNQLQHQMVKDILTTKSVEVDSDSETESILPSTPATRELGIVHSTPLLQLSMKHSTPLLQFSRKHSQSLHSELKSALFEDEEEFQQSPLCERSLDNIHSISLLEQSFEDSEAQFSEMRISLVARQMDFTRKLINEFNFAKNVLDKDLDALLEYAKTNVVFERPTSRFKSKFTRVLNRYSIQLEKLDIVNENADIIVGNLMQYMAKLQDEKNQLLYDKQTVQECIGDEEKPIKEYIVEKRGEIEQLVDVLERKNGDFVAIQAENNDLRRRCEDMTERLELLNECLLSRQKCRTPDLISEAPIVKDASTDDVSEPEAVSSRKSSVSEAFTQCANQTISPTTTPAAQTNRWFWTLYLIFLGLFLSWFVFQLASSVVPVIFSGKLPSGRTPWFIDIRRAGDTKPF